MVSEFVNTDERAERTASDVQLVKPLRSEERG